MRRLRIIPGHAAVRLRPPKLVLGVIGHRYTQQAPVLRAATERGRHALSAVLPVFDMPRGYSAGRHGGSRRAQDCWGEILKDSQVARYA